MTVLKVVADVTAEQALQHAATGCMLRDMGEEVLTCWSDVATRWLFIELSEPTKTFEEACAEHRGRLIW